MHKLTKQGAVIELTTIIRGKRGEPNEKRWWKSKVGNGI